MGSKNLTAYVFTVAVSVLSGVILVKGLQKPPEPSYEITATSANVLFIPGGSCTMKATSGVDEAEFRGYMALCLKAFQATNHEGQ